MKKYWFFSLAAMAALAFRVQGDPTNAAAGGRPPAQQEVGVLADHFLYHDNTVIYYDHVVVTNAQGKLTCERLTIDIPAEGSLDRQPTNAVAETNVVVDMVKKGDTNHITCDRAIYTYLVVNGTTNDTITFLGSPGRPAKVQSDRGWMTGEPLIWNNVNGNFSGSDTETHFKAPAATGQGTNTSPQGSPLNFLR